MDRSVIPAEAVEAAAKATADLKGCPKEWQFYLSDAKAALETAAPHMLADLRELVEDMEAQPPSEIGSICGMGGIIRATMKGAL